eukprot:4229870-Amphidinium_carterae.1
MYNKFLLHASIWVRDGSNSCIVSRCVRLSVVLRIYTFYFLADLVHSNHRDASSQLVWAPSVIDARLMEPSFWGVRHTNFEVGRVRTARASEG